MDELLSETRPTAAKSVGDLYCTRSRKNVDDTTCRLELSLTDGPALVIGDLCIYLMPMQQKRQQPLQNCMLIERDGRISPLSPDGSSLSRRE